LTPDRAKFWVDFAEARRLLPPRLQGVLSWVRGRLAEPG